MKSVIYVTVMLMILCSCTVQIQQEQAHDNEVASQLPDSFQSASEKTPENDGYYEITNQCRQFSRKR